MRKIQFILRIDPGTISKRKSTNMSYFRNLIFFALIAVMIVGTLGAPSNYEEFKAAVKNQSVETLKTDGLRFARAGKPSTGEWYARVLSSKTATGASAAAAEIRAVLKGLEH
ncbi:uncharacterized protein LOC116341729 [Contarinia nasturtii]|uniref:uncharacterized protein LOC116341729 n=1 Tax=Contarinia nasturtii TaxID=265458 RepID=UPI0012D3A8A1|nr:uncharacterized protein LOC116341729 [Contarinia nasturtii]